jgi:nucleotide-binding universal stress UspA family protein
MSAATIPERAEPFDELRLHRLLVAVDGSGNADLALKAAVTVARRDHASITLLLVGPDMASTPATGWVPGACDQQSVDEEATRDLADIAARIPEDIGVKTLYRRGKAGPEIVKAAKEGDYDAIVLGARGVGTVGSLLGSVSHYVLHHADIAVFVAHAPRS